MLFKSPTLSKLEKNRYSILTDDLDHCIFHKYTPRDDINEIFMGRNRINSMKYGLCVPLCRECHERFHSDRLMQLYFMRIGYEAFIKTHSVQEFKDNFRYVKGLDLF